ncbi:MAG: TetR/AcrR family transcriptional regulator [Myxococcaceae bacterium]|nr:TetR/AcrR family transcriptional regulator [Myxococcaceae bacterium]
MPRATSRKKPSRPRVRRPKQARSKATVDAVMEATARILERDGLAGFTTNKVAARAGVSIGSLYEYFDSKDAILRAWCERYVATVRAVIDQRFDSLGDAHPNDAVVPFLDAIFEVNLARPPFVRLLLEKLPALLGNHPLADIDDHLARRWEAALRKVGAPLPDDVGLRLYTLTRMGRSVTASWFIEGRGNQELPGLKRALAAIITASLSA